MPKNTDVKLGDRLEAMDRQLKTMKNIMANLKKLENNEERERVIGSVAVLFGLATARFPEDIQSLV
jgi:hypothetical protein